VVAGCYERGLRQYQRENGRALNLSEWYYRPPVTPAAVIDSELAQLEERFDLPGWVSLTDHDTIEGPLGLRANGRAVPISLEWSVPFEGSLFHLGVHGIAPASTDATMQALSAYTNLPRVRSNRRLGELLDMLGECPETFVVLNHPYWDLVRIGQLRHDSALLAFLRAHGDRIHALELNGFRPWAENRSVLPLATGFAIPVVGGGDRHALSPNAIVNLTRACDLAEFAHELRVERFSSCVVFPEYSDPFAARIFRNTADVLRPLPQSHRAPQPWTERVFINMDGHEQVLASLWEGEPLWLRGALAVTRAIASKPFAPLFEMMRADGHETLEADCRMEHLVEVVPQLTPDSAAA